MKLVLERTVFGKDFTLGKLYADGSLFCYTLEDVVRPVGSPKVFGATAIPTGTFKVVIDRSKRFGRDMPHVLDVPGFEGIRIHSGNTDKDTEGCILVGQYAGDRNWVSNSKIVFGKLYVMLQATLNLHQYVTLEVK